MLFPTYNKYRNVAPFNPCPDVDPAYSRGSVIDMLETFQEEGQPPAVFCTVGDIRLVALKRQIVDSRASIQ